MSNAFVIEVRRRDPGREPPAAALRAAAGAEIAGLREAWVFELEPLSRDEAERVGRALLADPALDEMRVLDAAEPDREGAAQDEASLTILRRDGVMDPVALSTREAAAHLGVAVERVRTAHRLYCRGARGQRPPEAAVLALARKLANPVVDRALVDAQTFPRRAHAESGAGLREELPLAGLDEAALLELSRARTLALDAAEMRAVQAHYAGLGRAPTLLELETVAQTWSEHCKHKTLTGPIVYRELDAEGREVARRSYANLLQQTIFRSTQELADPRCLSVFKDNAGVVRFDESQGVAVKVETHNHPSAIEPYGGAGTGIGGVIRDILGTGLGARPIANLDVFCVGDLEAREHPPGTIHPRDLLAGVVAGVRDYGNRMGIPTVAGAVVSEPRYVGNPLVFAGTVGLIPVERVQKAPAPGDWVVAVGGRTGRDGIHGATFSSLELSSESETESGGAVQIGNPIEEKKLQDVLLEVRDRGWLRAVTDCGAGGFSSAVGEMAEGLGAEVDLALAPLKYQGLAPWEVWISEAQERMVLAVPPERGEDVLAAFRAEDVEAVRLGTFAADGRLVVRWGETVVGELDLAFLHDGLPRQERQAEWRAPAPSRVTLAAEDAAAYAVAAAAAGLGERALPGRGAPTPGALLRRLLGQPTVCSKEWIVRQYDHEVQGASALKPLVGARGRGPSDGVAVAPVPGSARGVVLGLGIHPRLGDRDPYRMALWAIDEALRNVVAAGADPRATALLDNFSWGDCRRPDRLGAMVRAAEACRDAALAFRSPFISGKDSLNNEYALPDGSRVAIPGTLLVTCVAVVEDVARLVSMDWKGPGHPLLLVGSTDDRLGGSLLAEALGEPGGEAPRVDLTSAPGVLAAVHAALATGGVLACHDLSEGGLAVAAAESAFAGDVGARLVLDAVGEGHALSLLFAESPTRFLLELDPARAAEVEAALEGVPHAEIGVTTAEPLLVATHRGALVLDEPLAELERAWRATLPRLYGSLEPEGPRAGPARPHDHDHGSCGHAH
ncbi:MAG: phosphoribosylformylglycinamidine synthase subunit PurL [Planctomycetota bacterium]